MKRFSTNFVNVLIIFPVLIIVACNSEKQADESYNLQLHIEGIQYKSLNLSGLDIEDRRVDIPGKSDDEKDWNFVIPDSVYNTVAYLMLFPKPENADTNTVYKTSFIACYNEDTLVIGAIFLDREIKRIDMKYSGSEIQDDMLFYRLGAENKEESLHTANLCTDKFLIPYFDNTDFIMPFRYPLFGIFYTPGKNDVTYEEYIDQYLKMIEKYPDSRFLITQTATNLHQYKTAGDLQKSYNAFSEANRKTRWGKKIYDYILNHYTFSDTLLPAWDTGNPEAIITDTGKYNLVIFSASWCAPCLEEIPILKQIHADLSDKLDMTYVSIDEPKTADEWRRLMAEKNIPWRSVTATDNVKIIRKKYNVPHIPYCLFVRPGGLIEAVDVRNATERDYIYRTVQINRY